jgi:glycerate kinase
MIAELDAALAHYAAVIRRDLGAEVAEVAGAGAAGGLGAGLLAFAHAALVPGARVVLDALDFDARVRGADLVFTAEGRLDAQTAYGKAVGAVAAAAHRAGGRVVALAGSVAATDDELIALDIDAVVPLPSGPMSLDESMTGARQLVFAATARAMRLIQLGGGLIG